VAVALALLLGGVARAGIIYKVVDYPNQQNGYSVSGTITTDGTTGTLLPPSVIQSWDITISLSGVPQFMFTPANSTVSNAFTTTFDATPTQITIDTLPDHLTFYTPDSGSGYSFITWINQGGYGQYSASINANTTWFSDAWSLQAPIADVPFAAAPEPTSLGLLGIGSLTLLGYCWRRRQNVKV
jgi:hypothetical protein